MSIQQKILDDIKKSMKNKESDNVTTLRMVRSAIQNREIEKKAELTDDEVISVIQKEIKQYQESIEYWAKAKSDYIENLTVTTNRVELLKSYLPIQLTIDEIEFLVQKLISENNFEGIKSKGALMKILMPQVKGKTDGKLVNDIVSKLLKV